MKSTWKNPLINPDYQTPGDDTGIVGRTGQGSPDVYSCSYSVWLTEFAFDYDEDGDTDEEDYETWCDVYGFDPIWN